MPFFSKYISSTFTIITSALVCVSLLGFIRWSTNIRNKEVLGAIIHNQEYNTLFINNAISSIKTGDVVFRAGAGADSYLLSIMNTHDKTYSHCGIVIIENGYPFVYHSIGGEDNPDERLRRDSAATFFSPVHNLGMAIARFDMDTYQLMAMKREVYRFYLRRTKFDMGFDLATDDKLYCAELLYKVMNKAMNDSSYIGTSFAFGHKYVAIDNLLLNPHAHLICKVQYK